MNARTVLYADDQMINVRLIERKFKIEGFSIIVCNNGTEAVKIANEIVPDVILLDIMMPGMNGLEAAKLIKSNSKTKDCLIVFVTARDSREDKLKGFEAGCIDYITKPIDLSEIAARCKVICDTSRLIKSYNNKCSYEKIVKSICFPPERKAAGISILSYFSEYLKANYENSDAEVLISQEGDLVYLTVKPISGNVEIVQKALSDYGAIIMGRVNPREYVKDDFQIQMLENKLDMAALELRMNQKLFDTYKVLEGNRVNNLESEVNHLRMLIASSISDREKSFNFIDKLLDVASEDVKSLVVDLRSVIISDGRGEYQREAKRILAEIRAKDVGIYSRIKDFATALSAGIAANVSSPWFVSIINALPK